MYVLFPLHRQQGNASANNTVPEINTQGRNTKYKLHTAVSYYNACLFVRIVFILLNTNEKYRLSDLYLVS